MLQEFHCPVGNTNEKIGCDTFDILTNKADFPTVSSDVPVDRNTVWTFKALRLHEMSSAKDHNRCLASKLILLAGTCNLHWNEPES